MLKRQINEKKIKKIEKLLSGFMFLVCLLFNPDR